MSRTTETLEIRALTPLHVGSGFALMANADTLYFPSTQELAVLDDRKVLELIGKEQLSAWANCIEKRGDLLALVQRHKANLAPQDIATRSIPILDAGVSQSSQFREQMHDGQGRPYIPGSSLKGSIRTAFFTKLLLTKVDNGAHQPRADFLRPRNKSRGFEDKKLQDLIMGKTPNNDLLRHLRIGDAHTNRTALHKIVVQSYTGRGWREKTSVSSFCECIPQEATSRFSLKIDKDGLQRSDAPAKAREILSDSKSLFRLLNQHTKYLLENELEVQGGLAGSEKITSYIRALERLLNRVSATDGCVLRVGFGSGWKYITGYWQDYYLEDEDNDRIANELFDQIQRKSYPLNFPVPKTRKMTSQGLPLGFVEITSSSISAANN